MPGLFQRIRSQIQEMTEDVAIPESLEDLSNSLGLEQMRQALASANVEGPDIDASFDRGVHGSLNLGAIELGDTRIELPNGELHAGLWHDEDNEVQTGLEASGTALDIDNGETHTEIGHAEAGAGILHNHDGGFVLGGNLDATVGRHTTEEGTRYDIGTMQAQAGLFDADEGIAIGQHVNMTALGREDGVASTNVGQLSTDAHVGNNGLALGVNVELANHSFEEGATPSADLVDHRVRVGMSVGEGLAIRSRWGGDADGDGMEETSIGADLGPLSVDIGTEDRSTMLRDLSHGRRAHPIESAPAPAVDSPAQAPRAAPRAPRAAPRPRPATNGPTWDRPSATSVLAARSGRAMNDLMSLGPDGGRVYNEEAIEAAVRDFQRAEGLPETGVLDEETRARL